MKEKAKYKLGEEVICVKYNVHKIFNLTKDGLFYENTVETDYFGRKAVISDIQREEFETEYGTMKRDVDEYRINFTDNVGGSIAWIDGNDLIPLLVEPMSIGGWVISKCENNIMR